MKVLIMNTATGDADYILYNNGEVKSIRTDSTAKHSEISLKNIDLLLNEANLSIKDIDVVAVNVGPGSFTGVRIGVAICKGFLCAIQNMKVVAFDSFEPIAVGRQNANILIRASKDDYYHVEITDYKRTATDVLLNEQVEKMSNSIIFDGIYDTDNIVKVVMDKVNDGEFADMDTINPIYLKLSKAEQELEAKNGHRD